MRPCAVPLPSPVYSFWSSFGHVAGAVVGVVVVAGATTVSSRAAVVVTILRQFRTNVQNIFAIYGFALAAALEEVTSLRLTAIVTSIVILSGILLDHKVI